MKVFLPLFSFYVAIGLNNYRFRDRFLFCLLNTTERDLLLNSRPDHVTIELQTTDDRPNITFLVNISAFTEFRMLDIFVVHLTKQSFQTKQKFVVIFLVYFPNFTEQPIVKVRYSICHTLNIVVHRRGFIYWFLVGAFLERVGYSSG